MSLSEGNIADLYSIKDMKGFEVDSLYSYSYNNNYRHSNKNWLDTKVYNFLKGDEQGDWRSYSIRRNKVREDIGQLNDTGALDTLDLRNNYKIKTIAPLTKLSRLKMLNLSQCYINDWENLKDFKALETLIASHLTLDDLEHFKEIPTLKSLDIQDTPLNVQKVFIEKLPNIEVY